VNFQRKLLPALLFMLSCAPLSAQPPVPAHDSASSWRWTDGYTQQAVLSEPEVCQRFFREYARHEKPFVSVVHHPESGLAYDGVNLSPETGEEVSPRRFSAPSKECLDLGLLIKVLENDPLALEVMSPQTAREILAKKIQTYWRFHERSPGYGGYLPWYVVSDHIEPTPDWKNEVPGLDNGEWVWSLLMVTRQLRKSGDADLAAEYQRYVDLMRERAVPLFYDPRRQLVRADVCIEPHNANSPALKGHHLDYLTGEHGVHEGMMQVLFVDLLGHGLPAGAEAAIWNATKMKRIETEWGTTWQGYWGSAHESWAYLFLPLREIPEFAQLFRIREIIRSQNAVSHGYPGFATSALEPAGPGYLDGAGIEGVNSQPIRNNQLYTLYGDFPMLLEFSSGRKPEGNVAAAWLLNMLNGPKMQGPLGAGEAGTNDGRKTTYAKTIDGSLPILLAMMGGLERECAATMDELGVRDHFVKIMKGEYDETFASEPLRVKADFAAPTVRIPLDHQSDYRR
jgi:hypothetical protein